MTQATKCDFCGECPAILTDRLVLNPEREYMDVAPQDNRYRSWDICRDCLLSVIGKRLTYDAAQALKPLLERPGEAVEGATLPGPMLDPACCLMGTKGCTRHHGPDQPDSSRFMCRVDTTLR